MIRDSSLPTALENADWSRILSFEYLVAHPVTKLYGDRCGFQQGRKHKGGRIHQFIMLG